MPSKRPVDPLVLLPLRVSASFRLHLEKMAKANNITLSDAMREHIDKRWVEPLGRRPARPRGEYLPVDPVVMLHLAAIGNNLNQVARRVVTQARTGEYVELRRLIEVMCRIESELQRLVQAMVTHAD